MQVQVKYKDGTKWKLLPIEELNGHSILTFMTITDKTIMVAVMDKDNKPRLFIGNNDEELLKYAERGFCLNTEEMMILFNSKVVPPIALQIFPESTFEAMVTSQKINKPLVREKVEQWYQQSMA